MDIAGIALSMFIAICAIASAHVVARALKSFKKARIDLEQAEEEDAEARRLRAVAAYSQPKALHPYREVEAEENERWADHERRIAALEVEAVDAFNRVALALSNCVGDAAHDYHQVSLITDRPGIALCKRCGGTVKW